MPSHKSGLTMKKVTVRRGGRTFQRTQAVRASKPTSKLSEGRHFAGLAAQQLGGAAIHIGGTLAGAAIGKALAGRAAKSMAGRYGTSATTSKYLRTYGQAMGVRVGSAVSGVAGIIGGIKLRDRIHGKRRKTQDQVKENVESTIGSIARTAVAHYQLNNISKLYGGAAGKGAATNFAYDRHQHNTNRAKASTAPINTGAPRLKATNRRFATASANRIHF